MKARVAIGVVAAVVVLAPVRPTAVAAQCPLGVTRDASIPRERLPRIDMQKTMVWCWAASAQAAFRYYGYEVPQEAIVAGVTGDPLITTANAAMMISLLNRSYVDQSGRRFAVRTPQIYDAFSWLSKNPLFMQQIGATPLNNYGVRDALRAGHPIMYGTANHAMLLVSFGYQENMNGLWPVGGYVLDPAPAFTHPGPIGLRQLSPVELNAFFGAVIVVTRQ